MPEIELLAPYKIYFFLSLLFFFSEASAQVYPDSTVDSLLRTGINNVISQNYDEANKIFHNLNNDYPYLPLGKIYLAANKIAESYDYSEEFDEDYTRKNLEEAKNQSEKLIENDDSNIWYHYFLALCDGYTSYYEAEYYSFSMFSLSFLSSFS